MDLRGDGGYIVAPPAVHPSGARYTWELHPRDVPLAPMPEWLLALLEKPKPRPATNGTAARVIVRDPAGEASPWAEKALRDECERVAHAKEGTRNDTLNRAAFNLGQLIGGGHLERARVEADLYAAAEACGLVTDDGEAAVRGTMRSGIEAGMQTPRGPKDGGPVMRVVQPHEIPNEPAAPADLAELLATFHKWLHLPDEDPLLAVLAAVVANRAAGDPVWLLVVGSPGSGKTEMLQPLARLDDVHAAATLTEPGLLSGSPKKERGKDTTGGLLRLIGERGILLCKDFGSILSMHRDARAAVLAALREIYDGEWTRHVGADGGRTHSWSGHVGLIAGVTPSVDSHHAVMASLGERFILLRLHDAATAEYGIRALSHAGREGVMRKELAAAVAGFLGGVRIPEFVAEISDDERMGLVQLVAVVCRCRSAVERDGYHTREIELVPGAEAPGRLSITMLRLFTGLLAIGLERDRAWRIIRRVAMDSMPALRRKVLDTLRAMGEAPTPKIAEAMDYPTNTIRRVLEDLAAYHIVHRTKGGVADLWRVYEAEAEILSTVPEKSETKVSNILGEW